MIIVVGLPVKTLVDGMWDKGALLVKIVQTRPLAVLTEFSDIMIVVRKSYIIGSNV